jgi:hypothetical protein
MTAAADAIGCVPPFRRRMGPVHDPGGVTLIRDDYKAPFWSIPAVLQFMKDARAPRMVVVIGTPIRQAPQRRLTFRLRGGPWRPPLRPVCREKLSKCLKAPPRARHCILCRGGRCSVSAPLVAARRSQKGSEIDRFDVLMDGFNDRQKRLIRAWRPMHRRGGWIVPRSSSDWQSANNTKIPRTMPVRAFDLLGQF